MAAGTAMDSLGFVNLGDFAQLVNPKRSTPHAKQPDAAKVMNDFSSVEPSAGGYLIPETMRADIQQLTLEMSIIRPRATTIAMSSLTQLVPYVDHTTNVGSVFGGMVFNWTPEAGEIESSDARFGRVKLEANKLTGSAAVPNELWADAPGLASWINTAMPRGLSFYEDLAFFTGTGAGQPLGVLNSPAVVEVDKETSQANDTIVTENILNMYARMLPNSLGNGVWIANQTTFTQLMTLSISVGDGGAPVNLVDITSSPTPTLLGRPLILTEKAPPLGSRGDIGFYDLSYYLIGDRQAISMDASEHSQFNRDMTELRIIERVDGRPWIQSAFQPVNGATISPFVVLGERK